MMLELVFGKYVPTLSEGIDAPFVATMARYGI